MHCCITFTFPDASPGKMALEPQSLKQPIERQIKGGQSFFECRFDLPLKNADILAIQKKAPMLWFI